MEQWTVYCHIHVESGRRYVGLTKKRMLQRWNEHVWNAGAKRGKGCRHFWNAIRKYGKDAFFHEILEVCGTLEEANTAEEKWILHFDTRNPDFGFNLARGGSHTPHPVKNPWDRPEYRAANAGKNTIHLLKPDSRAKQLESLRSDDSKRKRSALTKASLASSETREKRRVMREDPRYGQKISVSLRASLASEEARARMADAALKSATPEVREKRSAALKQAMSNPGTRAKLSAASKNSWQKPEVRERILSREISEETRRKLSVAAKGRRHSPEAVAKMRDLAKARWEDPSVRSAHASGVRRHRLA